MKKYLSYPPGHQCKTCGVFTQKNKRQKNLCRKCFTKKCNKRKDLIEYRRIYYKIWWQKIKNKPTLYKKIKKRMNKNNKKYLCKNT